MNTSILHANLWTECQTRGPSAKPVTYSTNNISLIWSLIGDNLCI